MSNAYLYVTKCIYPKLLDDLIKDFPKKEQFRHCLATSLIKVLSHKQKFGKVNIPRKTWQKLFRSNYRRIIDNLIKFNIIAVQLNKDGKESYSNGKKKFGKCFYLTDTANASGYIGKEFGTPKPHIHAEIEQDALDEVQCYVKNILNNNITVDYIYNTTVNADNNIKRFPPNPHMCTNFQNDDEMNDFVKEIKDNNWLKRLAVNDFEVNYGEKGGRLYHPVICMSRVARKFIWFKNSDVVLDCDVKTAFPVLLTKFVHPDEKDAYKTALDADIYNLILAGTGKSRDDCKHHDFPRFLNGNISNYVKDWFINHFPKTAQWIEDNHETMASRLQRLESDIMIKRLGQFIIKNKIANWLPCHDGWLIDNAFDNQRIIDFVMTEIKNECGYCPKIQVDTRSRCIVSK